MKLADLMLKYRATRNITQKEAAASAGISFQTWNSIETGKQKPSRLTEAKIRILCERKEEE